MVAVIITSDLFKHALNMRLNKTPVQSSTGCQELPLTAGGSCQSDSGRSRDLLVAGSLSCSCAVSIMCSLSLLLQEMHYFIIMNIILLLYTFV